jgi:NTE family protein
MLPEAPRPPRPPLDRAVSEHPLSPHPGPRDGLAVVLPGGGARAAYQVGVLRCLGRHLPDLRFDVICGVSAGAINAAYLAGHAGNLRQAIDGLCELWCGLQPRHVYRVDAGSLGSEVGRWGARLLSGGSRLTPHIRSLVDTAPLRRFLARTLRAGPGGEVAGIDENLRGGRLRSLAITTLDYATGITVTWVQGRPIDDWERPNRRSAHAPITLDHVLASSSLPLLFPAVRVGGSWHGDGGVRLTAPLSPALHLGASRVLAVSTRYAPSHEEADRRSTAGYPPPAQILGLLMNAIFLDVLDQDVVRLELMNDVIGRLPPGECPRLRPVEILALRPSQDLGRLAADYEVRLPKAFRFLTRGLGTRETATQDFLSLLMFQPDYLKRVIEIGEADAEARWEELERLVRPAG